MKQLFNYTLLLLKAYIPNPKGYTHKPDSRAIGT